MKIEEQWDLLIEELGPQIVEFQLVRGEVEGEEQTLIGQSKVKEVVDH
jgi:hypothetical protein